MITVLYVGSNSINPSYSVLYDELARRSSPDLTVVDVSRLTPERVRHLCASSEVVALDAFIVAAPRLAPDIFGSVILDNWRGPDYYRGVWQAATEAQTRILYVASGWDLHWPELELDEILDAIAGIAWMFEKQPVTLPEVPRPHRDPWMEAQNDPLVNWNRVRRQVPVRVELIHSLAPAEFRRRGRTPLWDVCVAGDTYATRKIALADAHAAGLRVAPFRKLDDLILAWTHMLAQAFPTAGAARLRNRLRWADQRLLVGRSKVNFVCGSGYRYPVRKFFEVPAGRSALVCHPCTGFVDYGFVEGRDALVSLPEDFGRTARTLLTDEPLRQSLIESAWATVSRLHSVQRRVDDLLTCLRRLARDSLHTAQFLGGEFVVT